MEVLGSTCDQCGRMRNVVEGEVVIMSRTDDTKFPEFWCAECVSVNEKEGAL